MLVTVFGLMVSAHGLLCLREAEEMLVRMGWVMLCTPPHCIVAQMARSCPARQLTLTTTPTEQEASVSSTPLLRLLRWACPSLHTPVAVGVWGCAVSTVSTVSRTRE